MSTGFDGSIKELQEQSRRLAQSDAAREEWFFEVAERGDVVQQAILIWTKAIDQRQASKEDGERIVEAGILEAQAEQMQRSILCARIVRNAVVGSSECQKLCYEGVPSIIRILWTTTSFTFEQDDQVHLLNRALVQLLSNTITANADLQSRLWNQILCSDNDEADKGSRTGADLLGRLLQSGDAPTSTAAQVLLLNCIIDSNERCHSLSTSRSGAKLLSSLLELIQKHLDSDDGGDDSHSSIIHQKQYESLGVMYTFFENLFDLQLFGAIYALLAAADISGQVSITSLISQSQLTLLRLLDTYLHNGASTYGKKSIEDKAPKQGLDELIASFESLASWAEKAMKDALQGGSKGLVDPRLIEVHIGLVLLLQCLITLGMKTENSEGEDSDIANVARVILGQMRSMPFVQQLVSLLHTLAEFAPPISPFRPSGEKARKTPIQPPSGHAITSTGAAVSTDASDSGPALDNLKRDIVNLLGVLSYKRASDDIEAILLVQDTVREKGGLFDVMNMTQLDEHNPCECPLREMDEYSLIFFF
jgi:ataxin-10